MSAPTNDLFRTADLSAPVSKPIPKPTHVIGDVHGHLEVLTQLLEDAGLLRDGHWCGADARLLLMGDFFDRGPDGLGAVTLAMRLQREAAAAGGWLEALVGNHDVLVLAAHHFGNTCRHPFTDYWRGAGGVAADLAGLTPDHAAWLGSRPALLVLGDVLYLHADAMFYETLGGSVTAVNETFRNLLEGRDAQAWDALLEVFSEHEAFWREGGKAKAKRLLKRFGGVRLVHAHTPISKLTGQADRTVTAPLHYAGGLCTDVDHVLYRGGPGFIYRP